MSSGIAAIFFREGKSRMSRNFIFRAACPSTVRRRTHYMGLLAGNFNMVLRVPGFGLQDGVKEQAGPCGSLGKSASYIGWEGADTGGMYEYEMAGMDDRMTKPCAGGVDVYERCI